MADFGIAVFRTDKRGQTKIVTLYFLCKFTGCYINLRNEPKLRTPQLGEKSGNTALTYVRVCVHIRTDVYPYMPV